MAWPSAGAESPTRRPLCRETPLWTQRLALRGSASEGMVFRRVSVRWGVASDREAVAGALTYQLWYRYHKVCGELKSIAG